MPGAVLGWYPPPGHRRTWGADPGLPLGSLSIRSGAKVGEVAYLKICLMLRTSKLLGDTLPSDVRCRTRCQRGPSPPWKEACSHGLPCSPAGGPTPVLDRKAMPASTVGFPSCRTMTPGAGGDRTGVQLSRWGPLTVSHFAKNGDVASYPSNTPILGVEETFKWPRPFMTYVGEFVEPLFGTDGIRGVVGELYTGRFVVGIGAAFASWLSPPALVPIAWDFRTTSVGIARILAGTLQMSGVDVLEIGAMPTPCFQFNVRALGGRAGLMVTASHNPVNFNGIKFSGPDGIEISPEDERAIEHRFRNAVYRQERWDNVGSIQSDTRGVDRYLASIESHVDRTEIQRAAPKVVIDCGNGTSAVICPRLFRELGCRVSTLHANPDGSFPGRPSDPTDANLTDLKSMVLQTGAALGIAFDGDSDRLAVVDEQGHYIPGETLLALFARSRLKEYPGGTIVTSVTSSSCIDDTLKRDGGHLVVTRSGSRAVAIGISEHGGTFGGEENGHYYWPEHQNTADGPMSSAKVVELLVKEGRPLSELATELPRYYLVKRSVPAPNHLKSTVLRRAESALHAEATHLITLDGVKAYFPDGWLLIRPSGTEPLVRVFAESRSSDRAESIANHGMEIVRQGLVAPPT
jgi:phosphomannomutase/phosphoglucomutase